MRRIALSTVAFLMVAGVLGYLITNQGTVDELAAGRGGGEEPASAAAMPGEVEAGTTGAVVDEAAVRDAADASVGSVAELPGPPELGSAVVRTATLQVEVGEDGFSQAFDTATLIAGKYGGYVASSTTAGTEVRRGDLLIRVPSDRFNEALRDLRALGTVQRQELSGEDVSAQFVDLEARLRTWEAQEAVLLDLMAQATSIEATLRVQRELQDVQLRIEQIQGQLRYLEDRTELATIQVSLHEPGVVTAPQEPSTRPSLAEAWEKALDGFLGVVYSVVVGLGYLVPIAALGLIVAFAARRIFRPRPTATAP